MNTPKEDRDLFHSEYFDPFPQPQTIPAGWDLSGLFSTLALDPVEEAEDVAVDESGLSGQVDK